MPLPDHIFYDPRFHREIPGAQYNKFLRGQPVGTYHFWGENSEQEIFLLLWVAEDEDKKPYVTHLHFRCQASGKFHLVQSQVPAGGDTEPKTIYENLNHLIQSNSQELKKPLFFEQTFLPFKVTLPNEIVNHPSFHIGGMAIRDVSQGYLFRRCVAPGYVVLVNRQDKIIYYEYFRLIDPTEKQNFRLKHCFGKVDKGSFSDLAEIIKAFDLKDPIEFKTTLSDPLLYPKTPKELHKLFFSFLDNDTLLTVSRVSKKWNETAKLIIPGVFYQNTERNQKKLVAAIVKAAAEEETQEIYRLLQLAADYKIKVVHELRISGILCEVVRKTDIACLKLLIENGANINIADDDGYTPLMRAVEALDVEKVQVLLAHGARPGAGDYRRIIKGGGKTYWTSFTVLKQMQSKAPPQFFKKISSLFYSFDQIEVIQEYFLNHGKMLDEANEYLRECEQLSPAIFCEYFFNSLVKREIYRSDHFHKGHKYRWFDVEKIDKLVAELSKLPVILDIKDPWLQWNLGTLHEAGKNYELATRCYKKAKKLFKLSQEIPVADLNNILESLDKAMARVDEAAKLESTNFCKLS